ncbi:exodeoxyribonuclease V subunit gamma [Synechococcus sp. W4D4]|uniref:exodeoxyribonuclease V subunit gamma n=1 Tax=Synechococcus sp. W4D4 TaxID=3392294 RepID=UPI0039E84234
MLTVYRSNRAELLARVLATNLQLHPPGLLEQAQVVVNTWPTSRWLGEQLALANPAGIAANLRFPFPSSLLRQLVNAWLEEEAPPSTGPDPWRAQNLVWPLLELLPELLQSPTAQPLGQWLAVRSSGLEKLDQALWQLARAIADAIDDYGLYRPAMLESWLSEQPQALPEGLQWQPELLRRLVQRLGCLPFGVRARELIGRLQAGWRPELESDQPLRLFGLSSLAPVQVELLQALSAVRQVELYLLTPCRDLWQRSGPAAQSDPLAADWLLSVPSLEARFGRLGAEFQQLLEGTGESQLGQWQEGDLFFAPATVARHGDREPSLLEQLQEQLVSGEPEADQPLRRAPQDRSLEFHACPGRLRQLQVVRDQILQLLAADPSLEPRDILVMTPQVEAFAPLVAAVFGDAEATGVRLPWRLTDRSQQSEAGIAQGLLALLQLGGERLTATALESVLSCGPLLAAQQLEASASGELTALLQRAGFRWGLDGRDRGGDPSHSLSWAIDRLVLGLVLPEVPGLAPGDTAPMALSGNLEQQGRWIALLRQLLSSLRWFAQSRRVPEWVQGLREQLPLLFGDGGDWAWELQTIHAALADWQAVAADSPLELAAPVLADVLAERLSEGSGRFGHRSGALTISALEPMRAIPHRVVVLMGLDAGAFPRQRQRPGFHLMEHGRELGDPNSGDQDRYVLLEALLSARQHLLLSWSCRDERTGETLEASTPVRQWLELLGQQLGSAAVPLREHAANALERSNFLEMAPWPAASCDQRLLQVRQQLEQGDLSCQQGLAFSTPPKAAPVPEASPTAAWSDLQQWLQAPQRLWLEQLGIRPKEFDQPVLDLEALELGERERSGLLRREWEEQQDESLSPNWRELERGRGLLPPLAAGALEVEQLEQRWESLRSCLALLGEPEQQPLQWQSYSAEISSRGGQLVLVHTAKPRSPQRLQLWLDCLLAAAAGLELRSAALVGRDRHRFRVLERYEIPNPERARELLGQLQRWRDDHRMDCWGLPPETGWAYASAESSKPGQGRGWAKAKDTWEGGFQQRAERDDPIQRVCFGSDLPLGDLLTPELQALALALHGPLLECRKEVKA